jgi:hypothetical protein
MVDERENVSCRASMPSETPKGKENRWFGLANFLIWQDGSSRLDPQRSPSFQPFREGSQVLTEPLISVCSYCSKAEGWQLYNQSNDDRL